jgi:hypothetical protein
MIAFLAMISDYVQISPTNVEKPRNTTNVEIDDFASLNITDEHLTRLYTQARTQAIEKYPDAELSVFYLNVTPYRKIGSKILLSFDFHSKQCGRTCSFYCASRYSDVTYSPPDRVEDKDATFTGLPWKESPHWLQLLRYCYKNIGPLTAAEKTSYQLYVSPWAYDRVVWSLNFEDGLSGQEYHFDWNGKGIDEENIVQK